MKTWPSNYLTMEQNSVEWLTARIGKVTASRIADVTTKLKSGKYSAARETYKMEVLVEIVTGRATEHYVSQAMEWGIETEGLARSCYEMATGVEVEKIGMALHPTISRSSASPDGLIGDDGCLEIKCPTTTTHLGYVIEGVIPEQYIPQCMWALACTGRRYCDFVSYDPRLPQEYGLFIVRLLRDDALIASMEAEVTQFIIEVNEMAAKLVKYKEEHHYAAPEPENLPGVPKSEIPVWE